MEKFMDKMEIQKAIETIVGERLFEVRILSGKKTYSGYFTDVNTMLKEIDKFENCAIYFVFNRINEACYSREQRNKFVEGSKQTTSDNDISVREWVLLDLDPKRSSGVSSSDEEKAKARDVANRIYSFLRDCGFCEPICCDSGNGFHLLYKINLKNDDNSKNTIKSFLEAISTLFSNEFVDIDTAVFNASRITKMYGTYARKGVNTPERPHRLSRIIKIPDEIKTNSIDLLLKVCKMIPQPEKSTYRDVKYSGNGEDFDLDKFISDNNIRVQKVIETGGTKKYILEECPFDSNHKAPDACLFKLSNGAMQFKCFHSSCSQYTWKDFREKFDPEAYRKKEEFDRQRTTKPYTRQKIKDNKDINLPPQKEDETKGKKFLHLSDIKDIDRSKIVSIPTGFKELDRKIIGLNKGETSLWSGKCGCVDCDTEFFTGTGWKKISEYKEGDKVLQYNPDGTAELVYPERYIKEPCNRMTYFKSLNGLLSQCLSDEHNLVFFDSETLEPTKIQASTLFDMKREEINRYLIRTGFYYKDTGKLENYSTFEIRLAFSLLLKGTKHPMVQNTWLVDIQKGQEEEHILKLVKLCNATCVRKTFKRVIRFVINFPKGVSSIPSEWYSMDKVQREAIIGEMDFWSDSGKIKLGIQKDTVIDGSCREDIADFLQFAYSFNGFSTQVKGPRWEKFYSFSWINNRGFVHPDLKISKMSCVKNVATKDGFKYCFTVPSGMLVLRHNKQINITGNSGKSAVLNQIMLNAINEGFKVAIFSGELTKERLRKWIGLQAAGRQFTKSTQYENLYYVPEFTMQKIEQWVGDKLEIYNNEYGYNFNQLIADFEEIVKTKNIDMVIYDNLMSMDLSLFSGDKLQQQTECILKIVEMSKRLNVATNLVAHPRKSLPNMFLRKDDISGSADLTNAVENVFIVHRVNRDFMRSAREFFGETEASKYANYGNVIETCKNRDLGVQDYLVGLYYEVESKRFLNDKTENKVYGWQDNIIDKNQQKMRLDVDNKKNEPKEDKLQEVSAEEYKDLEDIF